MSQALPLFTPDRVSNYEAQTGRSSLTPRQRRRIVHKDGRNRSRVTDWWKENQPGA